MKSSAKNHLSVQRLSDYRGKPSSLVKIGEASKILGVSIDTLRRWEKAGKIHPTYTPKGTRVYRTEDLKLLPTPPDFPDPPRPLGFTQGKPPRSSTLKNLCKPGKITRKIYAGLALALIITVVTTAILILSYLANPEETKQLFSAKPQKQNLAAPYLLAQQKVEIKGVAIDESTGNIEKERGVTGKRESGWRGGEIPGVDRTRATVSEDAPGTPKRQDPPQQDSPAEPLPRNFIFPQFTLPHLSLNLPQPFDFAQGKLSKISLPEITFQLPKLSLAIPPLPSVPLPSLALPTFQLPSISLPTFQLPKVPSPTSNFSLPTLNLSLPTLNFSLPNPPPPKIPEVVLSHPEVDLPKPTLPTLPKLTWELPSLLQVQLTLPPLPKPEFSLPQISLTTPRPSLLSPDLKPLAKTTLSPFNFLAQGTIKTLMPDKAQEIGLASQQAQVLGTATDSATPTPTIFQKIAGAISSFLSPTPTPNIANISQVTPDVARLESLEKQSLELSQKLDSLSSSLNTQHLTSYASTLNSELITLNSLPTGARYTDLIGKTIIDSGGNLYPANSVTATVGTTNNHFAAVYANGLYAYGSAQLGNTSSDTVKIIGRLNNDLIPSGNGDQSLGDGDHYWKKGYINTITSDTGGFTSLSVGTNFTSAATTVNLINTTATTLNIGGAATTISLGASTGTTTINNNLSITGTTALTGAITSTGGILLPDGSVSSPALSFTNDTNSGLYRLTADTISLITGGTVAQGITVDSSGYIGIGTTAPGSIVAIQKTTDSSAVEVRLNNPSTGTSVIKGFRFYEGDTLQGYLTQCGSGATGCIGGVEALQLIQNRSAPLVLLTGGNAVSNERLRITAGGNVGVGTTNPLGTLVANNGSAAQSIFIAQDNGTDTFTIGDGGTVTATGNINANGGLDIDDAFVIADGGVLTTSQAATFNGNVFFGTSTGILTSGGNVGIGTTVTAGGGLIVNTGSVGIGTTAPGSELEIYSTDSSLSGVKFSSSTAGTSYSVGVGDGTPYNDALIFVSNTTQYAFMNSSGNWGYGFAGTPGSRLSASGNLSLGSSYVTIAAPTNGAIIEGNVGIGTTNPSTLFSVAENFKVTSDGVVTGGTYNKVAITQPASSATLTIADGKTLTVSNSLTLAGTDAKTLNIGANSLTFTTSGDTTLTLPTSGTVATLGGTETFSGTKTFSNATYSALFTGGNVGIGTTAPTTMLEVADDIFTQDNLFIGSTTESLAHTSFALDGDDLFVGGMAGVEGVIYTDNGLNVANGLLAIASTGVTTLTPGGTGTYLDFDLETEWTTGDLINADFDSGTTQTGALSGINIDFTNLTSVDGSTTYGILVNDLAAQSTSTEYGIYVEGTNWDYGLYVDDASYLKGAITSEGNLTLTKADPSIVFNTTTATDTDFWIGIQEDAGGDDDDRLMIGDGTTPGSNIFMTFQTDGNVGIGTTAPSQILDVVGNANISTGSTYKIAGTDVLSGTTLGSGVVTSSLTTVGVLASGSISANFGAIDTGADNIITTGTMGVAANTAFTGATGVFSTSATSPLIIGGTAVGSTLSLRSTSGVGTTDAILFQVGNNGATEAMRILNSGNVGIGTTDPVYIFDVQAAAARTQVKSTTGTNAAFSQWNNTGGYLYVGLENSTGGGYVTTNGMPYAGVIDVTGAYPLQFATTDSVRMTIAAGGNVGIGTTAPSQLLAVGSSSQFNVSSAGAVVAVGVDAGGAVSGVTTLTASSTLTLSGSAANIALGSNYLSGDGGDEGVFVNSTGIVGIGTASPTGYGTQLEIVGSNATDDRGNIMIRTNDAYAADKGGSIVFAGDYISTPNWATFASIAGRKEGGVDNDLSGYLAFSTTTSGAGAPFTPRERVRITATGNVGIGTTNPAHKIDVVGTAGLSTGTAWTNTSDYRFKDIQGELSGTSLDKVMALRPITYTWNALHQSKFGADPGVNYGFIAQEVKEIIPEFVTQDQEGYYWYNPSGMEAILTAAIQEQQAEINNLTSLIPPTSPSDSILGLQAEVASVSARLAELEKPTSGPLKVKVDEDIPYLKVRAEADGTSTEVGKANPGQIFTILETSGDPSTSSGQVWYKVEYEPGKFGWINKAYTSAVDALATSKALKVNENELGFLRVRSIPSTSGEELKKLNIGDEFNIVDEKSSPSTGSGSSSWYQIEYEAGKFGWVKGSYVSLIERTTDYGLPTTAEDGSQKTADSVATPSASLEDLVAQSASSSASYFSSLEVGNSLKAMDATISGTLKALGETFLGNTLIAGDLTIDGTLSLTGNSINSIPTLYIQNSTLAEGVDFFNGKVTIDKEGAVTLQKLVIPSSKPEGATQDPTIGSGIIPTGQTSVTIPNNQVEENSKIFITPRTKIGQQSLVVESVASGSAFTVSLDHSLLEDVKFDWWIIGGKE